ncbi:MAG: PPC domain-containing protein, partial [Candidatus Zixiibacteriota bacterium]
NEYIDCCVPGPGTYYIRVHYDNECNAYQLWWDDVSGCCDDQYEENDTRATCTPLSEGTWITAKQADDDWYCIDVTPGYERVLIDCRFSHAEGDIDIRLVNSGGAVLASSRSTDDNEYIDFTVSTSGVYYIQVFYGNRCNRYNLWWDDVAP